VATADQVQYRWLILGGIGVGAVVFGLGSRLAMRVVGILASPEHLGQPTEFGVVGKVTFAGVTGLVVLGAVAGLLTDVFYLLFRAWLPGGWVTQGLMFGFLLLSPVGMFIVASSKSDFDLISPGVILTVFAAMILIEGLATAGVIERLGRGSLPPPQPRALGYAVLGVLGSLGFVALGTSVSDL
jgi:hypothetical protein